jgi:thioredoxin 2
VDAAQFDKHRRDNDIALLVDVWAPWCGPCRIMGPMFERAAAELEPDVRLIKINADQEPRMASELGAAGIPALFLIRASRSSRTGGAIRGASSPGPAAIRRRPHKLLLSYETESEGTSIAR